MRKFLHNFCFVFVVVMAMLVPSFSDEVLENATEFKDLVGTNETFNETNTTEESNTTDNSTEGGDPPCPPISDKDVFELMLKNYSTLARPHKNGSETIIVTSALRLYGIQDFIERESIVYTTAYLDLAWTDEFMQWEEFWPHRCLKSVVIPAGLLWLPDFVLINSPDNANFVANSGTLKIIVHSDGSVLYSSIGRLQTVCEMDLTYFPFDRQICPIHFEAWTYPTHLEHLTDDGESNITIITQLWAENKQWRLIGTYTQFGATFYPDDSFDKVIYFLILERKALFYYINIIIPGIVIAIVELVTFFLPLTEVVKVHISFTTLLAYSVFQSMVIADLPRTSTSVPLLCLFIDLQMGYIGLALIGEGAVFFFAENAEKKRPISMSFLNVAKLIGRFFLIRNSPTIKHAKQKSPQPTPFDQQYFHLIPKGKFSAQYSTSVDLNKGSVLQQRQGLTGTPALTQKHHEEIWLFIAEVTERINCILYVLLITLTPAIMFGVVPKQQPDIWERLESEFIK